MTARIQEVHLLTIHCLCDAIDTNLLWETKLDEARGIMHESLRPCGLLTVASPLAHELRCVPLVIGGAVGGAPQVATDRRTTGAQLDDEVIEDKAIAARSPSASRAISTST